MLHLGRPLLAAVTLLVLVAAACGEDPAPTPVPPAQQSSPEATATATAAPTQPSAPPASQPPAAAAPVDALTTPTVELAAEIKNFTLPDLVVKVGTRVTWTNRDRSPHTSTSGSNTDPTGIWGSELLREGEAFSFAFAETGTFSYYCTVHPDTMNSVINVVAADRSVTPPGSGSPAQAAATADTPTPLPPTPTATDTPEPTAVPTSTAEPTATMASESPPTAMQEPTATPAPETPTAAPQPASTATPEPTATALLPTSTPAPAAAPTPPPAADQPSPSQVESSIADYRLQDLTVGVGTTIRWLQEDIVPHTTTAGTPNSPSGLWDSGFMDAGAEFSFTFDTPGTFAYFCEIHPDIMTATVTVVEGAARAVGSPAPAAGGGGRLPNRGL